jgi:bromodomain adjacent to zinc finger domain protein 1A
MGSASLLGSGGVVQYGTGRIFIQGPSEMDLELMLKRDDDDYEARRLEEEGPEGMLAPSEWAQYAEPEEVISFRYHFVDCR